ncbi:DUF7123 family protein [Halorubrum rutilum]|uniref:DUF7123 family protein n=1 Tax=Halorubrum rutilum TaxID=1364933 RepID=UPI003CCD5F54
MMPTADRDAAQDRIVDYLLGRLADEKPFVKSRYVAADLGISAKRAGHLLSRIESDDPRVELERRGGTSDGTTWEIARPDTQES